MSRSIRADDRTGARDRGRVRHQLLHHLDYLSLVVIHVDPADQSGSRTIALESMPRRAAGTLALVDVMVDGVFA